MISDRFIKLMMMTTSTHDGEVLNAIRMANAELASLNKNWSELLKGLPQSPPPPPPWATGRSRNTGYDVAVDAMFESAFYNAEPGTSFYRFLESVHEWWEKKGFLTEAQLAALKKAAK